jgi:hypothetical protein
MPGIARCLIYHVGPCQVLHPLLGFFGLDNRKMARPLNMRRSKKKVTQGGPGQTTVPLTPPQVAELYGFPGPPQGFNQTIGPTSGNMAR